MEPFYLNGWQYFQQGRRCGKVSCRCATSELHGPYWYRRHVQTRVQEYLGTQLDPTVGRYLAQRAGYADAVAAHIAQLARDQALLAALLNGTPALELADQRRLEELGYAHLLPPVVARWAVRAGQSPAAAPAVRDAPAQASPARGRRGRQPALPRPIDPADEPLFAFLADPPGGLGERERAWLVRELTRHYPYATIQDRLGWPYGRVGVQLALLREPPDTDGIFAAWSIEKDDQRCMHQLRATWPRLSPQQRAVALGPLAERYPRQVLEQELALAPGGADACLAWRWLPPALAARVDALRVGRPQIDG